MLNTMLMNLFILLTDALLSRKIRQGIYWDNVVFVEVKTRTITYLLTPLAIFKGLSVCLWLQVAQYFNKILKIATQKQNEIFKISYFKEGRQSGKFLGKSWS